MRLGDLGRAVWFAPFLLICSAVAVFSHALPQSVLTFVEAERGLSLTISLPVEELIIAHPGFAPLETAPLGQDLGAAELRDLAAYFQDHMRVEDGSGEVVVLSLVAARLERAENEHVGVYRLLVLSWAAGPVDEGGALSLIYDAVMHEVRSHRAVVFWGQDGAVPVGIAAFGYGGAQRAVVLERR